MIITAPFVNIIIDIIREMYGKREIIDESKNEDGKIIRKKMEYDFSKIDYEGFGIRVDIGTASYWSQLMQVQTMDSFFKNGIIDDAVLYLEHLPEGLVSGKDEIIEEIKKKKSVMSTEQKP